MNKNLIKILGVFSVVIVLIIKVNTGYAVIKNETGPPEEHNTELKYCPLFSSGSCDTCNSGKTCDGNDDCE
jgi:hypothetical protein